MRILLAILASLPLLAQAPTKADLLRGAYGRYRANNDLLSYHLDVRVDPAAGRSRERTRFASGC